MTRVASDAEYRTNTRSLLIRIWTMFRIVGSEPHSLPEVFPGFCHHPSDARFSNFPQSSLRADRRSSAEKEIVHCSLHICASHHCAYAHMCVRARKSQTSHRPAGRRSNESQMRVCNKVIQSENLQTAEGYLQIFLIDHLPIADLPANQMMPCSSMAVATFMKPAMLAPFT